MAGGLAQEFRCPIGFDTDVNAAALAEHRWGAGQDVNDWVYLTIGTGIGGGIMVGGSPIHGLMHPEIGHIFPGVILWTAVSRECAHSTAIAWRVWPRVRPFLPAREHRCSSSDESHAQWQIEADYLGQLCAQLVVTVSPRRIIMGGGVMSQAAPVAAHSAALAPLAGRLYRSQRDPERRGPLCGCAAAGRQRRRARRLAAGHEAEDRFPRWPGIDGCVNTVAAAFASRRNHEHSSLKQPLLLLSGLLCDEVVWADIPRAPGGRGGGEHPVVRGFSSIRRHGRACAGGGAGAVRHWRDIPWADELHSRWCARRRAGLRDWLCSIPGYTRFATASRRAAADCCGWHTSRACRRSRPNGCRR